MCGEWALAFKVCRSSVRMLIEVYMVLVPFGQSNGRVGRPAPIRLCSASWTARGQRSRASSTILRWEQKFPNPSIIFEFIFFLSCRPGDWRLCDCHAVLMISKICPGGPKLCKTGPQPIRYAAGIEPRDDVPQRQESPLLF